MEVPMQDALLEAVNTYGYFGILFLIFIENIFPPIPSEAVLLFGGFLTTKTDMSILPVIIAATAGSLLGAAVLYIVGCALGKERLKRLLSGRVGKILHLKPESVDSADASFSRHGKKAVLICRCIPIVRSLISIPAGMTKMRFIPFLLLTAVGSAVWNTILVSLGSAAGSAWEKILGYFGAYTTLAAAALVFAAAVIFLIYKRKNKES